MNLELHSAEVAIDEQPQYVFVADADLVHVGGGTTGVVDY